MLPQHGTNRPAPQCLSTQADVCSYLSSCVRIVSFSMWPTFPTQLPASLQGCATFLLPLAPHSDGLLLSVTHPSLSLTWEETPRMEVPVKLTQSILAVVAEDTFWGGE